MRAWLERLNDALDGWLGGMFDIDLGHLDEPCVLAYTPDEEIERGVEAFKSQWPDKWDAWLRWCEAEET